MTAPTPWRADASRRRALAIIGAGAAFASAATLVRSPAAANLAEMREAAGGFLRDSDWRAFKRFFLAADGRVVDTGNDGRSHSEGQGYGMLLAVAHDDPGAFLAMWRWTRERLRSRDDALLAWLWIGGRVEDANNATDGDLLVAWALLRAAERWGEAAWGEAAVAILDAVVERCVVAHGSSRLLLPGAEGFRRDDHVVVNPSYWIFPAFADFLRLGAPGPWREIAGTGEALIDAFAATRMGLPPDWCAIGDQIGPAEGFRYAFGFDAIRVPLYYRWSAPGERARERLRRVDDHARRFGGPAATPASIDLATGEATPYAMSLGGQAVLLLAEHAVSGDALALPLWRDGLDYYAAVLLLLTKLAATEMPA